MQNEPSIISTALKTSLFRHFCFQKTIGPKRPEGPGHGTRHGTGHREGPSTNRHAGLVVSMILPLSRSCRSEYCLWGERNAVPHDVLCNMRMTIRLRSSIMAAKVYSLAHDWSRVAFTFRSDETWPQSW